MRIILRHQPGYVTPIPLSFQEAPVHWWLLAGPRWPPRWQCCTQVALCYRNSCATVWQNHWYHKKSPGLRRVKTHQACHHSGRQARALPSLHAAVVSQVHVHATGHYAPWPPPAPRVVAAPQRPSCVLAAGDAHTGPGCGPVGRYGRGGPSAPAGPGSAQQAADPRAAPRLPRHQPLQHEYISLNAD